jgi:hypothetical protein
MNDRRQVIVESSTKYKKSSLRLTQVCFESVLKIIQHKVHLTMSTIRELVTLLIQILIALP